MEIKEKKRSAFMKLLSQMPQLDLGGQCIAPDVLLTLLFSEFLKHEFKISKALDCYNNSDQGESGPGNEEPYFPEMDEGHIVPFVSEPSFETKGYPVFESHL